MVGNSAWSALAFWFDVTMSPTEEVVGPSMPFADKHAFKQPGRFDSKRMRDWRGYGIAFGFGLLALAYQARGIPLYPPTSTPQYFLAVAEAGVLLLGTILLSYKQTSYYFEKERPGSKEGIWVNLLFQMNRQESDLDIAITVTGGMLLGLSLGPPQLWFFVYGVSEVFVLARCYVTLRRPVSGLGSGTVDHDPQQSSKWAAVIRNGTYGEGRLQVRWVLSGWVASHTLYVILAGTTVLLILFWPFSGVALGVGVLLISILLFTLIPRLFGYSYTWGKLLCRSRRWTRAFGLPSPDPNDPR